MGCRVIRPVIWLVVFSCWWACIAQSGTGSISGRVTDVNRHPVSSVSIATNWLSTNERIVATTDNQGLYSIANLSSGNYILELTHPGFASQRISITLGSGERKELSFVLSADTANPAQGMTESKAVSD